MLTSTEHEILDAYKNYMLKKKYFPGFQTLRYCIYPVLIQSLFAFKKLLA